MVTLIIKKSPWNHLRASPEAWLTCPGYARLMAFLILCPYGHAFMRTLLSTSFCEQKFLAVEGNECNKMREQSSYTAETSPLLKRLFLLFLLALWHIILDRVPGLNQFLAEPPHLVQYFPPLFVALLSCPPKRQENPVTQTSQSL